MKIKSPCSLLPYNTFGIKAQATILVEYTSVEELHQALELYHKDYQGLPLLHIGGGSNLLFIDDFPGFVLYSCIKGIEVVGEQGDGILVRVGAGIVFDDFVNQAIEQGWFGLENLSFIPGQVGAAAVQNIGAYGAEASEFIESVEGIRLSDGCPMRLRTDQCAYGYRQSIFKNELRGCCAITHVTWRLSRLFRPRLDYGGIREAISQKGLSVEELTGADLRRLIINLRKQKLPDPILVGNAGSFFMNPVMECSVFERLAKHYPDAPHYPTEDGRVKVPAGWLIDLCGWKGRILGRAAVHSRQALVLVNLGHAKGRDILRLCDAIRSDIFYRFGIELQPEVNIIPEDKWDRELRLTKK